MSARTRTVLIGLAGVAAITLTAAAITSGGDVTDAAEEPPASPAADAATVTVKTRDLVRSETLDGVVGHGDEEPLRLTGGGIITHLPAVGDVVEFGQPIVEVDGEPVVLLEGQRPAWRALGPGVSKGEDIRQLEWGLVALGYADPAEVVVDDTWTSATTAAVKRLQTMLGMPVDGRLDAGELVFTPNVVRVAAVAGSLGDAASAAGIDVTGLDQSVTVSLPASRSGLVEVGDDVTIEMPSGEEVDGVIESIGTPAAAGDGSVTFPVVVGTADVDVADGVPVEVTVDVVAVEGATAVPAEALLALAEGGYAVEVVDATSATRRKLVGVEVGVFADGWVQITGEVAAGDEVVVP